MDELVDPGIFGEDYLYFYEELLTPERSDAETDVIVRMGALSPGDQVLDAPCGHGRIANRLAARGMRVRGIDATPLFLDVARRDAKELGVSVDYIPGDLREIRWEGRFDAIVNWFTSFGYFDDETNRAVLAGFRRALKPGGRLLIEHMNRDRVLRFLGATTIPRSVALVMERGDDLQNDVNEYDPMTGRLESVRTIVREGKVRRLRFAVRVFPFTELRDWLLDAGFSAVEVYSGDGGPFTLDSPRMLVVATA